VSRGLWFAAGAGAGVYAMVKARRAAEALTPDGLRDRLAGLSLGLHLFSEEVRTGTAEAETELRRRMDQQPGTPAPRHLALAPREDAPSTTPHELPEKGTP